jgi:hypothetical protein
MQAISCQKVAAIDIRSRPLAGPLRSDANLPGGLHHLACRKGKDIHASACRGRPQCRVELSAAYATAPPSDEISLCRPPAADVADAHEIPAKGVDTEGSQRSYAAGHDTFAAGLVDRALSRLEHDNRQAAAYGIQGSREAHRATAHHNNVAGPSPHRNAARSPATVASACSSTWIRLASKAALRTVNTRAVTQAECTSGRAAPSHTTAT